MVYAGGMHGGAQGRLIAIALLGACADGGLAVEREPAAISGGTSDTADVAVVGIADDTTGATCTGALIAPNLVLTAQHCVAPVIGTPDCMTGDFGPPGAPASYYVTTRSMFSFNPSDYHSVAEVRIPPGTGFCGRDVALLVLADTIAATEAEDIVPRVDAPPAIGEIYAAVGFGGTDDFGAGSGERRRRDGLAIACVGDGCPGIAASEWVGEAGVCPGDSGGPALDGDGRVIGVASRGSVGCVSPVYANIEAHAEWLMLEAQRAATVGGYQPPPWATGASTGMVDAGPPDASPAADATPVDPPGDGGGCRAAGSPAPSWPAALLPLLLLILGRRACARRGSSR